MKKIENCYGIYSEDTLLPWTIRKFKGECVRDYEHFLRENGSLCPTLKKYEACEKVRVSLNKPSKPAVVPKYDFCELCGEEVNPDEWRGHMNEKHKIVLQESPKNEHGFWVCSKAKPSSTK